jgi:hypothetical protein
MIHQLLAGVTLFYSSFMNRFVLLSSSVYQRSRIRQRLKIRTSPNLADLSAKSAKFSRNRPDFKIWTVESAEFGQISLKCGKFVNIAVYYSYIGVCISPNIFGSIRNTGATLRFLDPAPNAVQGGGYIGMFTMSVVKKAPNQTRRVRLIVHRTTVTVSMNYWADITSVLP